MEKAQSLGLARIGATGRNFDRLEMPWVYGDSLKQMKSGLVSDLFRTWSGMWGATLVKVHELYPVPDLPTT